MKTLTSLFLFLCLPVTFLCRAQYLEKIDDPVLSNSDIKFNFVDKEDNLWFTLDSVKINFLGAKVSSGKISVGKYNGSHWSITEIKDIPENQPKHLFLDKEKNVWCLGENCLLKFVGGRWERKIVFYEIKETFYQGRWLKDSLNSKMRDVFYIDDNNNFWLVSGDENTKGMLVRYDGENLYKYPNTLNAKNRDIVWSSVKTDSKGDIWFLNYAFIRSGSYGYLGKVDFFEYCGYKIAADSLVKFEGLTEDFIEDGDQFILFHTENGATRSKKSIAVFSYDIELSIYSKSVGRLNYLEKLNEIPVKKYGSYICDGDNHEFSFIYGKNYISKYDGTNFHDINLDSLLNAKDVEIDIDAFARDGIWFATNEGILRYHDQTWDIFRKSEISSNADPRKPLIIKNWRVTKDKTLLFGTNLGIFQWRSGKMEQLLADPSRSFVVNAIDILTDHTLLYGTNMGIYRWNSGKLEPLLENSPQPFKIYGSDNIGTDTILYRTNTGIYQWNTGMLMEITSKFGLQKDLSYKTYRINDYYIVVFTDGTCSVLKDQKASHFVYEREYIGQGKKIFKGFGEKIITHSDSLLITLYRNNFNGKYALGIYSFKTDDWKYIDIPEDLRSSFYSYVITDSESDKFLWVITSPPFITRIEILHFDGKEITSIIPESLGFLGNNTDILFRDQCIWFTPNNNGLWQLVLNEGAENTHLEIKIELP